MRRCFRFPLFHPFADLFRGSDCVPLPSPPPSPRRAQLTTLYRAKGAAFSLFFSCLAPLSSTFSCLSRANPPPSLLHVSCDFHRSETVHTAHSTHPPRLATRPARSTSSCCPDFKTACHQQQPRAPREVRRRRRNASYYCLRFRSLDPLLVVVLSSPASGRSRL